MASTQQDPALGKNLPAVIDPNVLEEPTDFSLVLGGPVFQLFRRSHLAGDGLELVHRRLLIITLVAWAPHEMIADSFHHRPFGSVDSPWPMSRYDMRNVNPTDTIDVSHTSCVSGCSKFILSALPYLPF